MAEIKSTIVTKLDLGNLVRPNEYLGNVKAIDLGFTTASNAANDTLVLSDILPANAKLVALRLNATAIDATGLAIDIGFTGDVDGIVDGGDATSVIEYVGAPVAVGGKKLIGVLLAATPADGEALGYALITTDQ